MSKHDLMNDPFFATIVFHIELTIHTADRKAAAAGVELKDSNIKSSLKKVQSLAKGRRPKAKAMTQRDEFIHGLAVKIDSLRPELRQTADPDAVFDEGDPISATDWLAAVQCVEDSLKIHTAPGTRNYLDFLIDFIAEARGSENDSSRNVFSRLWTRVFNALGRK